MQKKRVIDQRNKQKFQMDDEYLNGYAKFCGIYATGVYAVLCRHASTDQECFPSMNLMAEKLGISSDSVKRSIKTLEDWHIVEISRERTKGGVWRNNTYTLLDKSVWGKHQSADTAMDNQSADSHRPEGCQRHHQSADTAKKETHIKEDTYKETHTGDDGVKYSKLGAEVIKLFGEFNPACKNFYNNKTQREATERLLNEYGFEKVKNVIRILPKTNRIPYIPSIDTPYLLEQKWKRLEDGLIKEKNKKENNNSSKGKEILQ